MDPAPEDAAAHDYGDRFSDRTVLSRRRGDRPRRDDGPCNGRHGGAGRD